MCGPVQANVILPTRRVVAPGAAARPSGAGDTPSLPANPRSVGAAVVPQKPTEALLAHDALQLDRCRLGCGAVPKRPVADPLVGPLVVGTALVLGKAWLRCLSPRWMKWPALSRLALDPMKLSRLC
jgi:hypothetical protein